MHIQELIYKSMKKILTSNQQQKILDSYYEMIRNTRFILLDKKF